MSDGMSDASASDDMLASVWSAAEDFSEIVIHLVKAVQRARLGHRGWNIARGWIVNEVNIALRNTGFKLVDEKPEKSFESYPDAYEHSPTRREKMYKRDAELCRDHLLQLKTKIRAIGPLVCVVMNSRTNGFAVEHVISSADDLCDAVNELTVLEEQLAGRR